MPGTGGGGGRGRVAPWATESAGRRQKAPKGAKRRRKAPEGARDPRAHLDSLPAALARPCGRRPGPACARRRGSCGRFRRAALACPAPAPPSCGGDPSGHARAPHDCLGVRDARSPNGGGGGGERRAGGNSDLWHLRGGGGGTRARAFSRTDSGLHSMRHGPGMHDRRPATTGGAAAARTSFRPVPTLAAAESGGGGRAARRDPCLGCA